MKITHILNEKWVEKPNAKSLIEEALKERKLLGVDETMDRVPLDEPIYVVEMTQSEYQLVSFYLELEKRKPIMNVKIDVEKENNEK